MKKPKELSAIEQLALADKIRAEAKERLLFRDKNNDPFATFQTDGTRSAIQLVEGHGTLVTFATIEKLYIWMKQHQKENGLPTTASV